jgi:molybdenum cofactor cytidylyltransferase
MHESVGVHHALGMEGASHLVAIVGGGGKSSLMFALAAALPGRVVMTTTTRIFASQMKLAPCIAADDDVALARHLDEFEASLLIVGGVQGDRAHGVPLDLPARLLAHPRVDHVVVEADGSRMLPVKAPAEHEPVVPLGTDHVVAVAGIDALSAPIADVAHRPERVSAITGLATDQHLTPEALARVLASPDGGLKNAPSDGRAMLLLNKVESDSEIAAARIVAGAALDEPRIERVAIGALQRGDTASWEVWTR